jgi:hypothetical protein
MRSLRQNVMNEGIANNGVDCPKMGEQMLTVESDVDGHRWLVMILFKMLTKKIYERRRFTISELSCEFPQISRTVLCEIIIVRLDYHEFCARWVLTNSRML